MFHRQRHPKHATRNGITLIFVVTMIVLFLLMGTAFVIVSNDFFKSARKRGQKHLYDSDGTAILERAFYDLVRGPSLSNNLSPLRGHSLLADMYGYGVSATVATATADSSEHFVALTLNSDWTKIIDGSAFTPDPVSGSMSGLLMSVVSGPAKGLTSRIVDHQVTGDSTGGYTHTFILLPSRSDAGFSVANANRLVSAEVLINGRPFSGSGAGHYDPFLPRGSAALSNTALQPNQVGRTLEEILGVTVPKGDGYFSISSKTATGVETLPNSLGPNESYDTFDFQNMFLAGLNPDGTVHRSSFHRPGLTGDARGEFRAFKTGGTNDDGVVVDNKNDGKPDGIWMDIGMPIENRPDGTCVKPLVSYLVVDLDGRINVNAHGSQVREGGWVQPDGSPAPPLSMSEIDLLGQPVAGLKRGQGYGPPEIRMNQVLGLSTGAVMNGSGGMPGRYGADGLPGQANVRDAWSSYKLFGFPDAKFGDDVPGIVDRHFGSAMDLHGRFAIGYSDIFVTATANDDPPRDFPIGMPVANVGFSDLANEIVDSPYEMSFVDGQSFGPGDGGFDSPFAARELEALFRQFDYDSRLLSSRLLSFGLSTDNMHSVTTHSFEVPTTYENLPEKLFQILDSGTGSEGIPMGAADRDATIRDQLKLMIPPEVFRGLPMNVNRAFGDGIDNDGNGVVDEMAEALLEGSAAESLTHPDGTQVVFDSDNDSTTNTDPDALFSRGDFARHLYIVTLLTTERVDRNGDGQVTTADWYDFNEDGITNADDWIDYRRVVAQWAVNVIDFRDPDSIMTPAEFDLNPWNGWNVDGDSSTAESVLEGEPQIQMRHLCWGAERPELLITETLATHDRRTQDLDTELVPDGETAATTSDADNPDEDFDSHLVPKVSAFFELYNPWVMNDANQVRAAELYDENLDGVDLQKTSLDGSSPVWRMVVTETGEEDLDPDDPTQNESTAAARIVRRIYFKQPAFTVDSGPEVYYPDDKIEAGSVGPGQYAVVGTAGQQVGQRYDTYFGRRFTTEALEPEELHEITRRISLDPKNGRLELVQWDPDESEMKTFERAVVTLPIGLNDGGWARELGVSDPVEGYFNVTGPGGLAIETKPVEDGLKFTDKATAEDFAFDEPVDRIIDEDHYEKYLKNDGLVAQVVADDVRPPYRVVHLQRLADPTRRFNATTNPYRTIDSHAIDLFAFNGAETIEDPNNMPGIMRFGTHERRGSSDSDYGQTDERNRLLFKSDRLGLQDPKEDRDLFYDRGDNHIFSWNLIESLAGLNVAYQPADPQPFGWLTWNNRPFVSQLELANVPHTSSYWMTRLFDVSSDDSRNVYDSPTEEDARDDNPDVEAKNYSAHFSHLLNFYADKAGSGSRGPSLHHVFDYLEVPSRFVGTESYVNPATFANNDHQISFGLAAPFDTISNYRYPGKININTVLDPRVWNGLMGDYASDAVSYPVWESSRNGSSGPPDYSNPFRPSHANNLVPPGIGVVDPVDCGLFRAGPNGPLFDYDPDPPLDYENHERAAYFRYALRQRLGNLVTTRSSVFAIWITVGYFEVDPDGSLKLGAGTGVEAGAETGDVHRHRAFFMFDRSIPVAFEPGKNHNVDRAVLVKSMIE